NPLGILAPSQLSRSTNWVLLRVPASTNLSGFPTAHQVALSASNARAASTWPAEKFSKKLRTRFLFVSTFIAHLLCIPPSWHAIWPPLHFANSQVVNVIG